MPMKTELDKRTNKLSDNEQTNFLKKTRDNPLESGGSCLSKISFHWEDCGLFEKVVPVTLLIQRFCITRTKILQVFESCDIFSSSEMLQTYKKYHKTKLKFSVLKTFRIRWISWRYVFWLEFSFSVIFSVHQVHRVSEIPSRFDFQKVFAPLWTSEKTDLACNWMTLFDRCSTSNSLRFGKILACILNDKVGHNVLRQNFNRSLSNPKILCRINHREIEILDKFRCQVKYQVSWAYFHTRR